MKQNLSEFQVVGRGKPTERTPEPEVFKMQVFARNCVCAQTKFWYQMKRLKKIKKAKGEILEVKVKHDRHPDRVKNFAIWLRYDSTGGTHNVYKEYRDTTITGAVSQMYAEMAGRHRARAATIQIMRAKIIADSMVKKPHMLPLLKKDLKFPLIRALTTVPQARRMTFIAHRPKTFQVQ